MNDKNMTMTHFATTLVMPKYLLFLTNLSLVHYTPSTNESVKINMWCRKYCLYAYTVAKNITLYLFDKWKRPNKT